MLALVLLDHLPQLSNPVNITRLVQTQSSHSSADAMVVDSVRSRLMDSVCQWTQCVKGLGVAISVALTGLITY